MKKIAPVTEPSEQPSAVAPFGARWAPAPGCRVRKLDGTLLDEAGEPLPDDPYYARLVADGDLVATGEDA